MEEIIATKDDMNFISGKEVCDSCYETDVCKVEQNYVALAFTKDNKITDGIIWYACGHVIIIKKSVVVSQYNFDE